MGRKERGIESFKSGVNDQLNNTNGRVNVLEEKVTAIQKRNIREDLEKRQPGGNYYYTQQQVADRNSVTMSAVRKVINEYGLNRN